MFHCNLQLAKKYHPDTNKSASAAEKFQEISEAYEVSKFSNIIYPYFDHCKQFKVIQGEWLPLNMI